jgi:MFS family permease
MAVPETTASPEGESVRPGLAPPLGAAVPAASAVPPAVEASTELQPVNARHDVPVWRNGPFLRLWAAQLLTQTAHNALWYALMVLVEQRSHSTTQMGVTILTVVIPAVLFGVVAGVLVDHWDKRRVLIVCNALRALLMVGFILGDQWLLALFVLSFVFSTVTQFFAPAETALIPELVHPRRLLQANSLFHITFVGSQLAGLVLVGPVVVKLFGLTTFFLLVGAALAVSAALVWPLPTTGVVARLSAADEGRRIWRRLRHDVRELLGLLRADREMCGAMVNLTIGSTLTLLVAMLAPGYAVSVLGIPAEDMVFIMAPAGVGMLGAALSLQHLAAHIPKQSLVRLGVAAVGVSLALVGILPTLWRVLPFTRAEGDLGVPVVLAHIPFPLVEGALNLTIRVYEPDVAGLVRAIMAVTLLAGVGFACIIVPAQTILQERAPAASRGRIFAVQLMLGSVASVLPLLFVGGVADILGTPWVFLGLGLLLLASLVAGLRRRQAPSSEVAAAPSAPPESGELEPRSP